MTEHTDQHPVEAAGPVPASTREKYLVERNKRMRADMNEQFREFDGELADLVDDPFVAPGFVREPVNDEVEIVLIGGGLSNIVMGAELRKAGLTDAGSIRVIDRAGDFGGTWYWNRYPGAQCDIESYIYLPMLEEMGYTPKHKYSYGPEILEHLQSIAKRFNLYDNSLFQTAITDMRWSEGDARWIIETDRGDCIRARFVVMANGTFSKPKLPGIPGIEKFAGRMMHTSRWDYDYTGGASTGELTRLHDKRVAVIGTGATGIQVAPRIAEWAEHLYVVQRTPAAVDVRGNQPTDPEWFASLEPGWQHKRRANFTSIMDGTETTTNLVGDSWTAVFQKFTSLAAARAAEAPGRTLSPAEGADLAAQADLATMDQIRRRIDAEVNDPKTAELLKPWYGRWCKRPCFHDEYLPMFNRDNVSLVDTDGRGVDAITETGFVVDGVDYPVDCIIFATGFEIGTSHTRRAEYDVTGRDGVLLSEKWKHGYRTFYGLQATGFPNCFFMGTTQTGSTPNYTHMSTEQAQTIAAIIRYVRDRDAAGIEPETAAEQRWVEEMHSFAGQLASYYRDCTPGFFSGEGDLDNPHGILYTQYGAGPTAFFETIRKWRESEVLEGLELLSPAPVTGAKPEAEVVG